MARLGPLTTFLCAVTVGACTGALPTRDGAPAGHDAGDANDFDASDARDANDFDASDAGDANDTVDASDEGDARLVDATDNGDAMVTIDATDARDATAAVDVTNDTTPSICASGQPVTPVSTAATYSQWTGYCPGSTAPSVCDNPVLIQRLLACDAVAVRQNFSQVGTDILQVAERRANSCVLKFWESVEAGTNYWTCELPLPLAAWPGLSRTAGTGLFIPNNELLKGIESQCTHVGYCCTAAGFCTPGCDSTYVSTPSVACN
jgi:hypothetical protein